MKNRLFTFILSICISLCLTSLAFAAIDLDLDDDTGSSSMKKNFFTILGGYDLGGSMDLDSEVEASFQGFSASDSDSDSIDIKGGFFAGIELGTFLNDNIAVGGGAVYQFARGIDEDTGDADPKFNFLPFYGMLKFVFPSDSVIPFGTVQVGYNLFFGNDDFKGDGDLSGGLYWGIGGGIMLDNGIQIQLLYSQNRGKMEEEGTEPLYDDYGYYMGDADVKMTTDGTYKKISISVGINL